MFDYETFNKIEKNLSEGEETLIKRHFEKVVAENDCFEDISQTELDHALWLFRHGWILRGMFLRR